MKYKYPVGAVGLKSLHLMCPEKLDLDVAARIARKIPDLGAFVDITLPLTRQEAEIVRWALIRLQPSIYLGFTRN